MSEASTDSTGKRRIRPPSLPVVEAWSKTMRTIFINVGFFIGFVLLLPTIASQFDRSNVVIEPIGVPAQLVKLGMKPDVMANRLWDGLQDFAKSATEAKASFVAIPDSQMVEFSLPDAGISIDSLFDQIRQFFHIYETRISGELVCGTPDCALPGVRLRLRVLRDTQEVVDLPAMGEASERDYFRDAAAGIYTVLDPFVAIAAMAKDQPLRAMTLARGLIRSNHPDAKWAHNLIGDLLHAQGKDSEAEAEYRSALAIDPNFLLAHNGLGIALAYQQHFPEAREQFAAIEAIAPRSVDAAKGFATVSAMLGDKVSAVKYFLIAADRDPLEPRHLVLAGQYTIELGDFPTAEKYLTEALAIDPGYSDALRILGDYYLTHDNIGGAEKLYRDWADYDPTSARARFSLGNVRLVQHDLEGALALYDEAIRLGDTTVETQNVRAGALLGLHRDAEAIAAFEAVMDQQPPEPTVFLSLGRLYQRNARPDDAVTAYNLFLQLAPVNHEQRADVEAQVKALREAPPQTGG